MKNKKNNFFILILAALFSFGASQCGGKKQNPNVDLPSEWTKDMHVSYYHGGGMTDESEQIEIYTDSAFYQKREWGTENKYKVKLTKNDRNQIAKIFFENNFNALQSTEHGTVYDAPSTSLQICRGSNCVSQSNDAHHSYEKEDGEKIRNIIQFLLSIVSKNREVAIKKFSVIIDELLLKSKTNVQYQMSPGNILYDMEKERVDRAEYDVEVGLYKLSATTYSYDKNKMIRYDKSAMIDFNTGDCNSILISLKDSILTLTPQK